MKSQLIVLSILCATLFGCKSDNSCEPKTNSKVVVGDPLPAFTISSIDNATTYDSRNIDKLTLYYFLWSECGDCRACTPHIMEVWKRYQNDPRFELVCITRGAKNATKDQAIAYWNSVAPTIAPTPMPTLYFDAEASVFNMFAESGVPRIYLADQTKNIIWYMVNNISAQQIITTIEQYRN